MDTRARTLFHLAVAHRATTCARHLYDTSGVDAGTLAPGTLCHAETERASRESLRGADFYGNVLALAAKTAESSPPVWVEQPWGLSQSS